MNSTVFLMSSSDTRVIDREADAADRAVAFHADEASFLASAINLSSSASVGSRMVTFDQLRLVFSTVPL